MSSKAIVVVLVVTAGFAVGTFVFLIWKKKHREIWRELFALRENFRSLRTDLVSVRKEAVRAGIRAPTRLPLLLPSQNGEEILLWNFFDWKREGFFVEVGAYDGVTFSNTYFFEAIGWSGILIEPMPEFADACRRRRPFSRVVHAAVSENVGPAQTTLNIASGKKCAGLETLSFIGENPDQIERIQRASGQLRSVIVPCRSLDAILADHASEIDFVSIDVEGAEMAVLRGFDVAKCKPRVLVVEDNSGGEDKRVGLWLQQRNYVERYRWEHNVFYTRSDDDRAFSWTDSTLTAA